MSREQTSTQSGSSDVKRALDDVVEAITHAVEDVVGPDTYNIEDHAEYWVRFILGQLRKADPVD